MEKTFRYRIYTELKNLDAMQAVMSDHFEGFTMYPAKGVWKGTAEPSVVIEVITPRDVVEVRAVASEIKSMNGQEAIFITREEIHAELI